MTEKPKTRANFFENWDDYDIACKINELLISERVATLIRRSIYFGTTTKVIRVLERPERVEGSLTKNKKKPLSLSLSRSPNLSISSPTQRIEQQKGLLLNTGTTSMSRSSIPPPPLDDPSAKAGPLDCPPLKWAILGCGRVSHDFTQALKLLPSQEVMACSTRNNADTAKTFAEKHGIPKSYGSYEEMIKADSGCEFDIVYVGNVHAFRRQTCEMCLIANKHLLVEKPFACTVEDAEYLINLAEERNLFIMEGMWTRFFPAVQKARDIALTQQRLGEITQVYSDFNFFAPDNPEHYPTSFVYNNNLGGGASFLVAPYPIAAATLFFPNNPPDKTQTVGQIDAETGVDLQGGMVLNFPPTVSNKRSVSDQNPKLQGSGIAILSFGMSCESAETTTIVGSKGRMTIESPAHCPTKLTVSIKSQGRGQMDTSEVYEYPLPEDTPAITQAGGFNYPNSQGFCYEAAAIARCIASNKKEAPQFTHDDTLLNIKLIEEFRKQLGVKPVGS